MKIILLISYILISSNLYSQGSVCRLNIELKNYADLASGKNYKIQITSSTDDSLDTLLIPRNNKIVLKIPLNEPFWFGISLKDANGKDIGETGSILATEDDFFISFNRSNGYAALVVGGEMEFVNKNRFLLFDLPASLYKTPSFNTEAIHQQETYAITNGNAYARYEEYKNNAYDLIKKYNNYYYVLSELQNQASNFPIDFLERSASLFSDKIKKTKKWDDFQKYIRKEKALLVGKKLPSVELTDQYGRKKNIIRFIGNQEYSFIDFWASWCIPCRKGMQDLKEFYPGIDTSKIKVMSVSIDEKLQSWKTASANDSILWEDYVDTTGVTKNVFNLSFIPQGYIVDKEGTIIERFVTVSRFKEFLLQKGFLK